MPLFTACGRIEQLIRDAGCEVLYLPPYSPDLNKIEKCWSWLTSRIRKQIEQFGTFRETMEQVLRGSVLSNLAIAIKGQMEQEQQLLVLV